MPLASFSTLLDASQSCPHPIMPPVSHAHKEGGREGGREGEWQGWWLGPCGGVVRLRLARHFWRRFCCRYSVSSSAISSYSACSDAPTRAPPIRYLVTSLSSLLRYLVTSLSSLLPYLPLYPLAPPLPQTQGGGRAWHLPFGICPLACALWPFGIHSTGQHDEKGQWGCAGPRKRHGGLGSRDLG
jgi:hypothetical protein